MQTVFIEASHGGGGNWGKFMVTRHTPEEWARPSALPEDGGRPLLAGRGWSPEHLWVMDLQTGEGAMFRPGGYAKADLDKHQVWVCPLFEPMLTWLYTQDLTDLEALPSYIELPDAPFDTAGYRRGGPE